ncbi:MAG: ChbG/HpnK family deacetylase [Candidatus Tectomicrobia bacterium]|nr:ChbG/HpnK family deacetylase [Candidatus Tectomicrobia bacterium]
MKRYLIVNADDFGHSSGISHGFIEAYEKGIVQSTSLMVNSSATEEAVRLAKEHPDLGVGLHINLTGEGELQFDLENVNQVREEFSNQLKTFLDLLDSLPTHIDFHHHIHRRPNLSLLARELSIHYHLPVRDFAGVAYNGWFYGQPIYGETDLSYVSVEFLLKLLGELSPGVTELSCHPGYVSNDFMCIYHREREVEIATLTDSKVKDAIEQLGIVLISYKDLALLPEGLTSQH